LFQHEFEDRVRRDVFLETESTAQVPCWPPEDLWFWITTRDVQNSTFCTQ
jgi:hypothetical protein